MVLIVFVTVAFLYWVTKNMFVDPIQTGEVQNKIRSKTEFGKIVKVLCRNTGVYGNGYYPVSEVAEGFDFFKSYAVFYNEDSRILNEADHYEYEIFSNEGYLSQTLAQFGVTKAKVVQSPTEGETYIRIDVSDEGTIKISKGRLVGRDSMRILKKFEK